MTTEDTKKYRVWNTVDGICYYFPVESPFLALSLLYKIVNDQAGDETIGWNAFGLEVFDEDEWYEWESEDGNDILAIFDLLEM